MIASLAAHVRKHVPSARSAKATASTSSTRICASIAEPALRPALSELPKRSNPKPTNITEQVPPRSCSVPYYAAKPLKRSQLRCLPGIAFQPCAGRRYPPLAGGVTASQTLVERTLPPLTRGIAVSRAPGGVTRRSSAAAFLCCLPRYRQTLRHPVCRIFPGGVLH